jgi:tetratricopeptide (TPR) repeat protein
VIDFGIAKATGDRLAGGTALTRQQMIGTPLYMSPEQAEGSADIDTRTDIYALGVVLYELVAGTTPFESVPFRSANLAEMQRIICEVVPTLPSARLLQQAITPSDVAAKRSVEPHRLRGTVRGDIDWIVMKAIEKDRQRRYATADALSLDIRRYLTGQPVTAAPPSKRYRLRKWTARNKGALAAASLIALSLLGGMLSFAWQAHNADLRAAEFEQVARFQAEMLGQVNPATAGELLKKDITAMFAQGMAASAAPEAERVAAKAAFDLHWQHVNTTDVARNFIDRTILEPAVAAIDEEFKDQPIVDAALRQVLAGRYSHIGLFAKAVPLQEMALATRLESLGESHPDTISSISGMAALLMQQGKASEAEVYFRRVLDKQRSVLGEDDPNTLVSIASLATILQAQGKLSEAEPLLREGVATNRRILGEDHLLVLRSLMSLAILLQRQGNLSEAEMYFREALDKYRRVLGAEHHDTLTTQMALGNALRNQGKLGEAEPYLKEALEKIREVRGNEHQVTLTAIAGMGNLLRLRGKLGEAEPLLTEALQTSRRVMGEEHAMTLISISNLGSLLVDQGRHAEAFELLAAAEAATRKASAGGLSFRLATFLTSLGQARSGIRERVAAETDLLEALDIFESNPGPNPQDQRECTEALVALYAGWHAESPGQGYDKKAQIWQRSLAEVNVSNSPGSTESNARVGPPPSGR